MSIIDKGLSVLGSGRQVIGLTGYYPEKGNITVDMDVTTSFIWTSGAEATSHPVEKDADNPSGTITDHIIAKLPTLVIEVLLTDNIGYSKATSVSMKDKIKIISYWQRSGSIITLKGYTTGQSDFGKTLNYFKGGITSFFKSDLKEDFYLGLDTDEIDNLVLGDVTWKRLLENGENASGTINLKRIFLATAKKKTVSTASNPNRGTKPNNAGKTDPKTAANQNPTPKSKSLLQGGFGL